MMPDQRLWAPWRMRYVRGERTDEGCIFCLAGESGDEEARLSSAAVLGPVPAGAARGHRAPPLHRFSDAPAGEPSRPRD
jgi:hypothetical protein